MAWTQEQIGRKIAEEAAKTGADPLLILSVAWVESRLDPSAVGDGGTSFGLFQNHAGGAGGPTIASARRYLDPAVAIPDACRRLASARTGAQAAAIQRPANQAAYAQKVDQALMQARSAVRQAQAAPTTGYGLTKTSGDRTPAANNAAGGSSTSDHLTTNTGTWAQDYAGPMEQMKAFQRWAMQRGGFKQVIGPLDGPAADHMDHVHIAGHSTPGKRKWSPLRDEADRVATARWTGSAAGGTQMVSLRENLGALAPLAGAIGAIASIDGAADAARGAAGAVAGAAGDIAGVVTDAIEKLLKGGFRYSLIIAGVSIASLLILVGSVRAFGAAGRSTGGTR